VRDPARIDRILELLREVWKQNPDMRLGQLLVNAIRPSQPCPQIFGPEDEVTERGLQQFLKTGHERYTANEATLDLSMAEALVLLTFLLRFRDREKLRVEHEAEQQVLWDVCALLEQHVGSELTDKFWPLLLDEARKEVVAGESSGASE
jgi:hypothetical protein